LKISKNANKPSRMYQLSSFSASTPSRKLYRSVVNSTAKKGYRADLRAQAVARASAVKLSQKERKERAAPKLRGAKARKAKEGESS
jgi:large subunit ribosomal protein L28e